MSDRKQESTMNHAASQLRAVILSKEEGAFIGSEIDMQKELGISRTTLRQVARLLEREGLLTVRRGLNGGYFANRPDTQTVEAAVTAYLEILDVRIDELMALAAVTWEEALRQASDRQDENAEILANRLAKLVRGVGPNTRYQDLILVEKQMRRFVFDFIDTPYMSFIFQINLKFVERKFEGPSNSVNIFEDNLELLSYWRSIKMLEVEAIRLGDRDLAALAAQKSRRYWDTVLGELSGVRHVGQKKRA